MGVPQLESIEEGLSPFLEDSIESDAFKSARDTPKKQNLIYK